MDKISSLFQAKRNEPEWMKTSSYIDKLSRNRCHGGSHIELPLRPQRSWRHQTKEQCYRESNTTSALCGNKREWDEEIKRRASLELRALAPKRPYKRAGALSPKGQELDKNGPRIWAALWLSFIGEGHRGVDVRGPKAGQLGVPQGWLGQ